LFAGPEERVELAGPLRQAFSRGTGGSVSPDRLQIVDFDIGLEKEYDYEEEESWKAAAERLLREGANGNFDVVYASPPCRTTSRARFANRQGPKPVRSRQWPRGVPWLAAGDKTLCEREDRRIDFALAMLNALGASGRRGLLDHPEDLGETGSGCPATIWDREECIQIGKLKGFDTGAIYQCHFGDVTARPKPTRMLTNIPGILRSLHRGWPRFGVGVVEGRPSNRIYGGPLPGTCSCGNPHEDGAAGPERGKLARHGKPENFTRWIADSIIHDWVVDPGPEAHCIGVRGADSPLGAAASDSVGVRRGSVLLQGGQEAVGLLSDSVGVQRDSVVLQGGQEAVGLPAQAGVVHAPQAVELHATPVPCSVALRGDSVGSQSGRKGGSVTSRGRGRAYPSGGRATRHIGAGPRRVTGRGSGYPSGGRVTRHSRRATARGSEYPPGGRVTRLTGRAIGSCRVTGRPSGGHGRGSVAPGGRTRP